MGDQALLKHRGLRDAGMIKILGCPFPSVSAGVGSVRVGSVPADRFCGMCHLAQQVCRSSGMKDIEGGPTIPAGS